MFKPKIHHHTEPFRGDLTAAFGLARTALVSQGFEILEDGRYELHARGPGMQSNRQPPIVGASDVLLRADGSEISVTATLGGVANMTAFVMVFPPALILSLSLFLRFTGQGLGWGWVAMMVAPWVVVSPWMAASMERRTRRAVDAMLRGMVQVGARG